MPAAPPFTEISPTNQQPGLWVLSILCPIYSILILLIRYTLRRRYTTSDIVLSIGYGLGLIYWIITWAALQSGVGKATSVLSSTEYRTASDLTFAGVLFALLAFGCALSCQCIHLAELVALFPDRVVGWSAAGGCASLTIISSLTVLAGCTPSRYLNHSTGSEEACGNQTTRWIVAGVLLSVASCLPASLPPYLFGALQTDRHRKISIYLTFAAPLLNIPLIALMVYYFSNFATAGQDSLAAIEFLSLMQVLVLWAFACATIPCLRPFALKFTTTRVLLLEEATAVGMSNGKSGGSKTEGSRSGGSRTLVSKSRQNLTPEPGLLGSGGVVGQSSSTAERATGDDAASMTSFGSRRGFIIKKTVGFSVHDDQDDIQEEEALIRSDEISRDV